MSYRRQLDHPGTGAGDAGFSMIATVLSMVATALLVAILLGTTLHSGGNSDTSVSNAPGVAEAEGLQAQQSLTTGMSTAAAAASTGGYAAITPSALSASNPSISFVAGASSSPSVVSVAVSPGQGTGFDGGSGGSVTMASRSGDGVCWLTWKSANSPTWYGAQSGLASCTAPAIASAPSPGPVSSTAIGWQQGSFPTA